MVTITSGVSGCNLAQINSECLLGEWHIILKTNLIKRGVILENNKCP
jgi:hypothetical protein